MNSHAQPYPYTPNYAMYSRAPEGWHDEPFEYVFNFQQDFPGGTAPASQATFLNQPMQFDPDADFYMRGMAILADYIVGLEGGGPINFTLRLKNPFGRALDSLAIPLNAYAATPNFDNSPVLQGPWQATPWFPEMYCPANSALWGDFTAITTGTYYSLHIYFQGVKRFQNEQCRPGDNS
jgi:hypothetical protein